MRVSAVSYLNTKPFLYGLFQSGLDQELSISLDMPALCAQKLVNKQADIGLVPVAAIPSIQDVRVISDFCIGTEGEVKTVCIYAQCPIEEITTLYLDYQSRTSVALTRYLVQHYWKIQPQLIAAKAGYENTISGTTAALIIGDRTIGLDDQYPYIYDLGTAWKTHTGLPFVFAAWVATRPLSADFEAKFNAALALGIERRAQVAQLFQSSHPNFSVYDYYHQYIDYQLTKDKRQALDRFLGLLNPSPSVSASK